MKGKKIKFNYIKNKDFYFLKIRIFQNVESLYKKEGVCAPQKLYLMSYIYECPNIRIIIIISSLLTMKITMNAYNISTLS